MLCGALSGLIAQTVAYPLEVTRRRMQTIGIVPTSGTEWAAINFMGMQKLKHQIDELPEAVEQHTQSTKEKIPTNSVKNTSSATERLRRPALAGEALRQQPHKPPFIKCLRSMQCIANNSGICLDHNTTVRRERCLVRKQTTIKFLWNPMQTFHLSL